MLVAVLVTFGVLTRTNEFTAMKATGISLYRVMVPILVVSALIAVALFLFDESYLPGANRRQEALRSVIKGRPAQTFLRPDQKWIFGRQEPGKPGRIFYYQFFDPDTGPLRQSHRLRIQPGELSLFPAASLPPAPTGSRNCSNGSLNTGGSAGSTAKR